MKWMEGNRNIQYRVVSDRAGAAMVEFAFIAIPLFILIFGMLQTVLVFVAKASLDSNLQAIAYDFSNAGLNNASTMPTRETLCSRNLFVLVDCRSSVDFCFAIIPVDQLPIDQVSTISCTPNTGLFNKVQGTFAFVSEYEVPPFLDIFVLLKNLTALQTDPPKIRSVAFAFQR